MNARALRTTPNAVGDTTSILLGETMFTAMPGVATIDWASLPKPSRSMLALMSSAVSGEPSWNLISVRIVRATVVGLSSFQAVATEGTIFPFSSQPISVSWTSEATCSSTRPKPAAGSQ